MLLDGKYDGKAVSNEGRVLTKLQLRLRLVGFAGIVLGIFAVALVLELDLFDLSLLNVKQSARAMTAYWNDEPLPIDQAEVDEPSPDIKLATSS